MANGIILYQHINLFKLHRIEILCRDLDIKLVPIRPEDQNTQLGVLFGLAASGPGKASSASSGNAPGTSDIQEMLVLCGLSPDLFNRFLEEYRFHGIEPVALKAVLTSHNAKWTPKRLQTELIREHRALNQ